MLWLLMWVVPAIPITLWLLHRLMVLMDHWHRRQCRHRQLSWPYKTVPHVREKLAVPPSTDTTKWRLRCTEGRQLWQYDESDASPQTFLEKYQLSLTADEDKGMRYKPRRQYLEALEAGANFLTRLQDKDGHWPNDYGGPQFLLPGAVYAKYIIHGGNVADMFPAAVTKEMSRYIANMQNQDGGWGMHSESHSTMLGTVLNFVALRLLGSPADSVQCAKARAWIKQRGGAESTPSWGKVWLCTLGLAKWDWLNPVPPEMWLLPDWVPFSMGRMWCHSRIVTLPFGYLYGKKFSMEPVTAVVAELRTELYSQPFASIDWASHRYNCFCDDLYTPHSPVFRVANEVLRVYERFFVRSWRERALKVSMEHIRYDDVETNFICLGPVNKTLNMLCTWIEDGGISDHVKKHFDRLHDYMWMGPDGMRMNGYNGSQLWDTSFACQALVAAGMEVRYPDAVKGAHAYIDVAQVREDPPEAAKYYRHRTKGCWNFSTRAQSWQVSDCTAEGLRIVLMLRNHSTIKVDFEQQRIYDAVDEILSLRNVHSEGNFSNDGGWCSYEPVRGHKYLETLDCAEIFKDIMVDYTYTECSSSCVHTLILFQRQFPGYRTKDVADAIAGGVAMVKKLQRRDGSWYGSWGVCFTYAAWLATDALTLAGEDPTTSPTLIACCRFLLSKQRSDGGWGEDFNACVTQEWVENPDGSQIINTAWAVMSLLAAGGGQHLPAIERGVRFMMSRQLTSGDWPQERISGVFNGNCSIHYAAYKNVMPVWALGKYHQMMVKLGKVAPSTATAAAKS